MGVDAVLSLDPRNMGLMLEMKGHNLRKAKPIDIRGVPGEAVDPEHVCVKCVECGQMMRFVGWRTDDLDGWWQCSGCYKKVTQLRVYKAIEADNEREEERWNNF